jgi:hypothetical protein
MRARVSVLRLAFFLMLLPMLFVPPGLIPTLDLIGGPKTGNGLATESSFIGRAFEKEPAAEGWNLTYTWRDIEGRPFRVSFSIPRPALEDSERSFGYVRSELEEDIARLESELRQTRELSPKVKALELASRSPYAEFFEVREEPSGEVRFIGAPGKTLPPEAAVEINKLQARLDAEWMPCHENIKKQLWKRTDAYLKERGLVRSKNVIGVRYDELIRRYQSCLRPLAEEIRKGRESQGGGNDLEAVLSFVQAIPSREIPMEKDGRYIAGLAVPLSVLVEDTGNCGSKAVLFAAIWRNLHGNPLALIKVPNHMLVGVAAPFTAGTSIVLNSARYLLCEMCPSEPAPAGVISDYSASCLRKGQVKYVLIR